jgi:predicted extracellular nuclease
VGGNLKVAGFNVLNYFTDWGCGANCRGANNATEFQRQRDKLVAAINTLDADVIGITELQNNGTTALNDLVGGLNTAAGSTKWAGIVGASPGTDAIQVAFLYQPAKVTPIGAAVNDTDPVHNRAPLAQVFRRVGGSRDIAVVVNHFKSKGSCPTDPNDPNAEHGQGCWNVLRNQQAQALLTFAGTLPTSDVLFVGDFNAYDLEDPIQTIKTAGYSNETERLPAADRYSFVFNAESGDLDHIMASPGLQASVTGADIWHINADEPIFRDYNTEFNPPAYYQPDAYRSSDHDPALVGLDD